jgi:hypothetical protein
MPRKVYSRGTSITVRVWSCGLSLSLGDSIVLTLYLVDESKFYTKEVLLGFLPHEGFLG